MKKYLYIFLVTLSPIFISSCASNDAVVDNGSGSQSDDRVALTIDNLVGTWEIYYMQKFVNGISGFRSIDYDGFTTTFRKDGTYEDRNPFGDLVYAGKFELFDKDSVRFFFKLRLEGGATKDTITARQIPVLRDKFLTMNSSYQAPDARGRQYLVQDVKTMRNVAKAPGQHPGVDKATIDFSSLIGTWSLYEYFYYQDGQLMGSTANGNTNGMSDRLTRSYRGTTYIFSEVNGQKTITVNDPNGKISGPIKIVDDVIYIRDTTQVVSLKDRRDSDDGFYIWIKSIGANSQNNRQRFIDQSFFRPINSPTSIIRTDVYFEKTN